MAVIQIFGRFFQLEGEQEHQPGGEKGLDMFEKWQQEGNVTEHGQARVRIPEILYIA